MKHFQNRQDAPNQNQTLKRRPLAKHIDRMRTRHGKIIFYFRDGRGRRTRLPNEYGSAEFWAAYEAALKAKNEGQKQKDILRLYNPDMAPKGRIGKALSKGLGAAKQRAKERHLPFDLDYDWAVEQVEKNNFSCALTGIKFFSEWNGPAGKCNPMIPSIDRIVPSLGYVKSNCRVVLFGINAMLLDWGEDLFLTLANNYKRHKHKRYLETSAQPGPTRTAS